LWVGFEAAAAQQQALRRQVHHTHKRQHCLMSDATCCFLLLLPGTCSTGRQEDNICSVHDSAVADCVSEEGCTTVLGGFRPALRRAWSQLPPLPARPVLTWCACTTATDASLRAQWRAGVLPAAHPPPPLGAGAVAAMQAAAAAALLLLLLLLLLGHACVCGFRRAGGIGCIWLYRYSYREGAKAPCAYVGQQQQRCLTCCEGRAGQRCCRWGRGSGIRGVGLGRRLKGWRVRGGSGVVGSVWVRLLTVHGLRGVHGCDPEHGCCQEREGGQARHAGHA
jgi:hypothetical protein